MWDGRSFYEYVADQVEKHRGKAIGILLGLLVALLWIIIGFWKMFFIAICILIGYFVGKRSDDGGSLGDFWRRMFGKR
jgi:uncharacterized membrane protein